MKKKQLKEHIKQAIIKERKMKKVEVNDKFFNAIACFSLLNELHIITLYKLYSVKTIYDELKEDYEQTIKNYDLHLPTMEKIRDNAEIMPKVNKVLVSKGLKEYKHDYRI